MNPSTKFDVPAPPPAAGSSPAPNAGNRGAKAAPGNGKGGRGGRYSGGKGSWSWTKHKAKNKRQAAPILQGKAAKRARQLEKPHGDKVVAAKELWNKLRDRNSDAGKDPAARSKLVDDIMALIGGDSGMQARHDATCCPGVLPLGEW